jgi:hypothetical protein
MLSTVCSKENSGVCLSLEHELTSKASASKRCYLVGPRPTVGRSPVSHGNSNLRRSSCRWKTWSMHRWSASIRAKWSQFPAFIMETNGHVLRPHPAPCCHSSALPSPRPLQESSAKVGITGEKCACREYNTRSRVLCAVVDRVAKPARGLTNNDHNGDNK